MNNRQEYLLHKLNKQLGGGGQKKTGARWLPALLATLISISFTLYVHARVPVLGQGYQVIKVNQSGLFTGV